MMAQKALLFRDNANFHKIISCDKPGEAKELGRQILGFNEHTWNENRFKIVKTGSIHKFNQYPKLATYLLNTEDRILVEASPVDIIWGIGLSPDSIEIDNIYAWRGQNLLGFALMEARDFLREFGHFKTLDNCVQPPWNEFPNINKNDIFWRMGKGENYLLEFSKYYRSLSKKEKVIHKLTNPEPLDWKGFYE